MSVPTSLPYPRLNVSDAALASWASTVTSTDIIVAAGDYTGGASEDLFTLASHGLIDGDMVHVLWQSAMGGVTGGVLTKAFVDYASSSTFHLCSDFLLTTTIENTADATVVLLKGRVSTAIVRQILPLILCVDWDYTGGTVEDMGTSGTTGLAGLYEGDTLKLLYKSAAGVTAGTAGTTYYAKAPTVSYFQIAATNGGSVIDSTADGTAVFLKTS